MIPPEGLIENPRFDAINGREIAVEHDGATSNRENLQFIDGPRHLNHGHPQKSSDGTARSRGSVPRRAASGPEPCDRLSYQKNLVYERENVWACGRFGVSACGGRIEEVRKKAMKAAKHFRDLDVYQNAMAQVMRVFELTKDFRADERFALTDQKIITLGLREYRRSMEKAPVPGSLYCQVERCGSRSCGNAGSPGGCFPPWLS